MLLLQNNRVCDMLIVSKLLGWNLVFLLITLFCTQKTAQTRFVFKSSGCKKSKNRRLSKEVRNYNMKDEDVKEGHCSLAMLLVLIT